MFLTSDKYAALLTVKKSPQVDYLWPLVTLDPVKIKMDKTLNPHLMPGKVNENFSH